LVGEESVSRGGGRTHALVGPEAAATATAAARGREKQKLEIWRRKKDDINVGGKK
jgi:hypothetical protein